MTVDSVVETLNRWRSLRVRRRTRIVQFFSDGSPDSWYATRFLPSRQAAESFGLVETAFLSRTGFSTQINLAVADANPRFALFHRRTITSSVYLQITSFPDVTPAFVVLGPRRFERDPTFPLSDWAAQVQHAREGRCLLVVEEESEVAEFARLGVRALYLPPQCEVPLTLRVEAKSPSDFYRVLISAEASPAMALLSLLTTVREWQQTPGFPSGKPMQLQLSLREGHNSSNAAYKEGLIRAAVDLFGTESVVVWPQIPRDEFLRKIAREVDAVVEARLHSALGREAVGVGVSSFSVHNQQVVLSPTADGLSSAVAQARFTFWRELQRESTKGPKNS